MNGSPRRLPPDTSSCDAEAKRYFMTDEEALVFANPEGPLFAPGAFEIAGAMFRDEPKIAEAFRSGQASDGASMMSVCSAAPSGSSVRPTQTTWLGAGSRRSTA